MVSCQIGGWECCAPRICEFVEVSERELAKRSDGDFVEQEKLRAEWRYVTWFEMEDLLENELTKPN